MKIRSLLLVIICLSFPAAAWADEFMGVPLLKEGQVLVKTGSRLEMKTSLSHDEVVDFYQGALKDQKDIKFREWKHDTYIEDDGRLGWHSITISKEDGKAGTRITIIKDNWTWIMGTLFLRFVGVFVVLMILFVGMSVAGSLISRSVRRTEAKKAA